MKVEITEAGVYDGNHARIPVGTQIDVPGDVLPAWLVNKARPVTSNAVGKTAVTNPAKGALPGDESRDDLKTQADELGLEYLANIPTKKLKTLIAEALAK